MTTSQSATTCQAATQSDLRSKGWLHRCPRQYFTCVRTPIWTCLITRRSRSPRELTNCRAAVGLPSSVPLAFQPRIAAANTPGSFLTARRSSR